MPIPLTEIRKLSHDELVELVANLWEVRPGWRTRIVETGDEVNLEIKGDSMEMVVPQGENPRYPDVEIPVHILAIQEEPYVELEFIHVHQANEEDVIEDAQLDSFEQASNGYRVRKSVIVTTGAGPDKTVDEQLYYGHRLVEGAELCNLIEQYTEYGFDHNAYLR
jgi:hypothetical protein